MEFYHFLLILAMMLIHVAQSLFCRLYSNNYPGAPEAASPIFSMVSSFVVAIVALILCGFSFDPHPLTLLFGTLNAVMLIGYNKFIVKASNSGPFSIQMVFILSGGILVPAFANLIRGTEKLSLLQWVAVALIIVSIIMVNYKKDDKKVSGKGYLLFCIGLFITNGLYSTLLNLQQDYTGLGDKEEMIILSYGITMLAAIIEGIVTRRKQFLSDFRQNKKSLTFLLLCSAVTTTAINLFVFLINLMGNSTTILFTFDNAGVLLFSVICSYIFFKEKLSKFNLLGCLVMGVGLVMISVF